MGINYMPKTMLILSNRCGFFGLFVLDFFFKQNKLSLFLRIGTIGASVFLRIKGCLNNVLQMQSAWIVPPLLPGKFLRFVSFFLSLVPACSSEIPRIPPPRLMSKEARRKEGGGFTPPYICTQNPTPCSCSFFSSPPHSSQNRAVKLDGGAKNKA